MDEGNNHCSRGKRKKSNLSINHKSKKYRLESSQSSSNSSQFLDDSSSSSDLDECNSLNIPSSQTTESNILHEGATGNNEFGMHTESTSICKYQQTVHECHHVHVLVKPATFIKSTQALHITKVYNNLTQTFSTHKHVSVALKSPAHKLIMMIQLAKVTPI